MVSRMLLQPARMLQRLEITHQNMYFRRWVVCSQPFKLLKDMFCMCFRLLKPIQKLSKYTLARFFILRHILLQIMLNLISHAFPR